MLSPYPRTRPDRTRCLNGVWDFQYLGDEVDVEAYGPADATTDAKMTVPGVFDASPAFAGKRGVGLYRIDVDVTPGRAARLRFDGLGLWAKLFVDREAVGTFDLPYGDWDVPVPPADHARRRIDLLIDNRLHPERTVLVEPYFDFYLYGGVYRGVWLRELPGPAIERVDVTVLDLDAGRVAVTAHAYDPVPDDTTTRIAFDDAPLAELTDAVWDGRTLRVETQVPDPRVWSPDDPRLHTLTLALGEDRFTVRFGLRTVRVDGPRLLLNGAPLKLKGVCRHEAHPQFGPALPDAQIVQDLQLLQQLGCNFVRGAHYPQDPRFLDLCDETGLLVFEESLGWQPRQEHFENPHFVERIEAQTRRMVRKSFNHPSVILWGFLNEADTPQPSARPVFERLVHAIRDEDPTRPVTFAVHRPFQDVTLDLADVVSVNAYPGWYADIDRSPVRPLGEIGPHLDRVLDHLAGRGLDDRPFILSEIGAGAIYGWHDPLRNHWTEGYQADLLEVVCRKFRDDDRFTGLAVWQFCDGRTYANSMALKRPRSFNNKGLYDEYRRPKLAADVVARG